MKNDQIDSSKSLPVLGKHPYFGKTSLKQNVISSINMTSKFNNQKSTSTEKTNQPSWMDKICVPLLPSLDSDLVA